jgi:hypothetical protein
MAGEWRGKPLRWYRGRSFIWTDYVSVSVLFAILAGLCIWGTAETGGGAWLGTAVVTAPFSLYRLVGGFRAGIGVGADGVLVRQGSGRSQWVPWTEIERFGFLKKKYTRGGVIFRVVVVRRDAKPLSTDGCTFSVSRARRGVCDRTIQDLEHERLTANHRLGLAS